MVGNMRLATAAVPGVDTPNPTASLSPAPVPSGTATVTANATADSATAIPGQLLAVIVVLVALLIIGMFVLTIYNLSAPRSTLRNLLGQGRGRDPGAVQKAGFDSKILNARLIETLGMAARPGVATTRTTLAVTAFGLLGICLIAVLGMSGDGVRDLRSQVLASITTLAAAIAGFYFGTATTASSKGGSGSDSSTEPPADQPSAPALDFSPPAAATIFHVGQQGSLKPTVTGTPRPTITVAGGTLPPDLKLDPVTGVISGVPAANAVGDHPVTLTAANGQTPDATANIVIHVQV